jgi:hypothetical protein
MRTVEIKLPDALAREAASAGLLAPASIERLLRERLRADRIEGLARARQVLANNPPSPMTPAEIAAEIASYRADSRRAAGS